MGACLLECQRYGHELGVRTSEGNAKSGGYKIGGVSSFLFTGLHHVAALMKDGFCIWDAKARSTFISRPFFAYGAADGPGMTYLNGAVGHLGAHGCRLYCTQKGRLKPGGSHYYPACLKPHNYNIEGSSHNDVSLREPPSVNYGEQCVARHAESLRKVLGSRNPTVFKRIRLETGLTKPSLFSGLPSARRFPIPLCFPADIMHLVALNIPDLYFALTRGTLACNPKDDKATWDWICFKGDPWKTLGDAVANARTYLPGSFDRPPRNPAKAMNSGYKAIEYLTLFYGLGPAMFRPLQQEKYWQNYCKLVRAVQLLHQRR
ncbi:hypothetical protein PHLCEN_2v9487 [Hermanssonia centrifuga]|uniref:Uncharacterized protein n=1 Tax=Hermanssonia centrifuga TaxID=98765 RepID=A0A2R6NQP2_9APHY|nr:hypothetical protein PHLCEN_2v9487 [Hermanssonia centrifuga]